MAALTKCPEFNLDADDAKRLGEASAAVLAFHHIKMTPKQEAYALLIEAGAQVYPPMLVTIYFRKKMEAEQQAKNNPRPATPPPKPPAADNVSIFRPPSPSNMPVFDPGNIKID